MTPDKTSSTRLFYVDNLRIFLIGLVMLHHFAITYGAPGGWYYKEGETEGLSNLLFTLFVATNQSFFMGLFFMISAYFIPGAYDRKGSRAFLLDRLLRLGIPLLFFVLVISPVFLFVLSRYHYDYAGTLWAYYLSGRGFSFGPMWFVEALLYFTLLYVVYCLVFPSREGIVTPAEKAPGDAWIVLFGLLLGILTFMVRIWLPVGWSLEPLGLQFPHFVQYIAFFITGLIAYRKGWLVHLSYRRGLRWFGIAQVLIFVVFPVGFVLGGAGQGAVDRFLGGWHWQSVFYSFWEQMTGLALILGLLGIFKEKANAQGKWARSWSASVYTVFIIHTPVLIFVALAMRGLTLPPLLKFTVLAPFVLILCFLLAYPIRKLPYARRIL